MRKVVFMFTIIETFFIVQETVEDARLKTLMIYLFTVTSLEWCIFVKMFYSILITTLTFSSTLKAWNVVATECLFVLTSFLCFNSSLLKLLRSKAKNKLSTIKFPTTRAGMKIARQDPGLPCDITNITLPTQQLDSLQQSYRFSLNSHAVPQWFYPLPAQYSEDHHEGMEKIGKIPSEIF